MKTKILSQRGQALVLIILAIVGVLGVSALAIDGGMIYAERRRAQNAADAAVYAGALVRAKGGSVNEARSAALAQATTNGFTADSETSVQFLNPPQAPNVYSGDARYYQVIISGSVTPIFSQFVFSGGAFRYTVEAVARAAEGTAFAPGAALFATSTAGGECDSIFFMGNGNITIRGGDVISNNPSNSGNCTAGQLGGSGNLTIQNGGIKLVGGWRQNGSGQLNGTLTTGIQPVPLPPFPEPDCASAPTPAPSYQQGGYTWINPGKYTDFTWQNNSGNLMLNPGMYCFQGSSNGGFKVLGGNVSSYDNPNTSQVEGVFFVILSGNFSIGGNGAININRADNLVNNGNQYGGYLLYMPYNNTGNVTFGGGSGTMYTGTVYAPGPTTNPSSQPKCVIDGGAGNVGLRSQVICYNIKVVGNANIEVNYNSNENGQIAPVVDLIN